MPIFNMLCIENIKLMISYTLVNYLLFTKPILKAQLNSSPPFPFFPFLFSFFCKFLMFLLILIVNLIKLRTDSATEMYS